MLEGLISEGTRRIKVFPSNRHVRVVEHTDFIIQQRTARAGIKQNNCRDPSSGISCTHLVYFRSPRRFTI